MSKTKQENIPVMMAEEPGEKEHYDEARAEATFRFKVKDFSKLQGSVFSPSFIIRNLPWELEIRQTSPKDNPDGTKKSLGYFLNCNSDSESSALSCNASAELKMYNYKEDNYFKKDIDKQIFSKDTFCGWGYLSFMAWNNVLDLDRGFIKDDSVIFEVKVNADAPQCKPWDPDSKNPWYDGSKYQAKSVASEKSNIIAKLSSAVNGNAKEILTAYSTFYAAKLSGRLNEADTQGCGKFHLEEGNEFSWMSVFVLIDSINASTNGSKMPYHGDWMKDNVNLIVEIIQLCNYIGCAPLQAQFVHLLNLQANNTNIKNVTQLFAASKNLNSIVELKGNCKELEMICISFLSYKLKSSNNVFMTQWMLDNKDNMDLVLELLEKVQSQ